MFTWGKKLVQRQSPLLASLHPRSVYIKKRTNIFDWRKPEIEDMVLKILEDNVSCPKEAISLNASTQWDLLMNHREQYVCAPVLDSSGICRRSFSLTFQRYRRIAGTSSLPGRP
ncbi:MAG: hypothetical protein SGCHY_000241 [Lobulomycetales sp.]